MKKAKILIVEDEKDLNDAYSIILSSAGHEVATAFNGKQALDTVEKNGDPDLILLDLRMPVLDGIGFLEKYQPKEKHPDVCIIVFSNYDMQTEVDKAYELGAERYVLKALATPSSLLKIVNDLS